jgi:hypothetical protein
MAGAKYIFDAVVAGKISVDDSKYSTQAVALLGQLHAR